MRITCLQVSGYRSLHEIDWRPERLNILIGPNGSGKTNLMRLLELLSASVRGKLADHVKEAGGIEPFLYNGAEKEIDLTVKTTPVDPGRDPERDSMTYELRLARLGKSSAYRIDHELLGNFYRCDKGLSDEPFKFLERDTRHAVLFDEEQKGLVAPEETVPEDETLLSVAAGPFAVNRITDAYHRSIAAWRIYHDLHPNTGLLKQPPVARLERYVSPDGGNLVSVLHTLYEGDRDFKKEINAAMRAAFGDDFEELVFPPAADQRIQLRVRWRCLKSEQSISEMSYGTLRFLFLLAILANPEPPPLIGIDEPELGLHPRMMAIIAEYAAAAAERSQVIIATHSPAFLDAFTDAPAITVLDWADGKTVLRQPPPEVLERWLSAYRLGEVFRSGELENME